MTRATHHIAVLFSITALLALAACETTQRNDSPSGNSGLFTPAGKTLKVGVARSAPPLIFEQNNQDAGLEVDMANALGKELGRKVELVPVFFPDLLFALRQERIDIVMAGMSITDARKKEAAFSNPYMTVGQQALVRSTDKAKFANKEAIIAKLERVGVENGSTGAMFAGSKLDKAFVVDFKTVRDAIDGLVAGKVDAVIHDSPTIAWYARELKSQDLFIVPGRFTEEPLGWAVRKDDEKLLGDVNRILAAWRSNGTLARMVDKWAPGQ